MKERILLELQNHSRTVFNNLDIELSDVLNNRFQEVLIESVNRMEREKRTSETDIIEARQAVRTFVFEMYPYRERREGQKDLVRFQALNESRSSICPLWPIC